jgi:serine/threonine protein kinase
MNNPVLSDHDLPSPWVPGSTVLDEFLVERPLGMGGFGRVELVQSRHSGHRYAVKRILLNDPLVQGKFLTEARCWMGIPPHDHIVACHFVRTIGRELAVFTEFVPGGSLADKIDSGQLLAGSTDPALYRIIDIAAQSAWGLDAAHAMGLLHLDVKPANILLSDNSIAKITDFGLATTREQSVQEIVQTEAVIDYIAGGPDADEATREVIKRILRGQFAAARADESIEGRPGGATSAYASLEQAEGRTVGRGADVWSWGLVLLEMFAGGRTWPSGTLAAPVLERVARSGTGPVEMPPFVHDLLRRCFRDDPADRPHSLREAASELTAGIEQACGQPFRRRPPARPSVSDQPQLYQRLLVSGARWEDPRAWLDFAYRSAGLDLEQAVRFWPTSADAPRSMAIADLGAFVEARRVLAPVADQGSDELKLGLARLNTMIAMVQRSLGDEPAAIENYRRAVEIDEDLEGEDARADLVIILGGLSIALRETGNTSEAVAAADRQVSLARKLPEGAESHRYLGGALQTKANALPGTQERLDLFQAAVAEYEAAGDEDGIVKGLAAQAQELERGGRQQEAQLAWRRVDDMLDSLIGSGRRDLRLTKAAVLLNRAVALGSEGDRYAADAATLLGELVGKDGFYELTGELGTANFVLAQDREVQGKPQEAVSAYRAARLAFEDAVLRDGRTELAHDLAQAYDHESTLVALLGDDAEGVRLAEQAVAMWTRVSGLDDVSVWRRELAEAHTKLAGMLRFSGDIPGARSHAQEALTLLDRPQDSLRGLDSVYLAHAQTEMAAIERAEGDPAAAAARLQRAFDVIADDPDEEAIHARATILLRLGNALTDLRSFEDAVAAFDESIEQAEGAQRMRTRSGMATEARHGRVNALLQFGDYDHAVAAAEESLNRYAGMIADGRADLRGEQARLRAAMGQALFLGGDLPGAIAAWKGAGPVMAESGGNDGALAARQLARQVDELQDLLSVTPADVPERIDTLREEYASATRMSQAGEVRGASILLENYLATGLALYQVVATDALLDLCGQIGLAVGVTAMHSSRDAAAIRGFDLAAQCYRTLYDRFHRPVGIDRWCDAQVGIASVLLIRGDQAGAESVMHEAEPVLDEIDPAASAARLARMRHALDDLARSLAAPNGGTSD